jgi:hypothetical protein
MNLRIEGRDGVARCYTARLAATISYATSRDSSVVDRRRECEHGDSISDVGMEAIDWKRSSWRIARVFAALALVAATNSVTAATVYKCRDADGHIAYQDRACAATQQQSEIELVVPPPAPSVTEDRSASAGKATHARKTRATGRAAAPRREVMSWECRGADGEVFYRHAACPKSIPDSRAASRSRKGGAKPISVSATPLPRAEACRRLARAGSIGRPGHEHDEAVSTYDKNAGRDPCRRY